MKNYCLTISYLGKKFSGWQRLGSQENTIQGKIESVLQKMTGIPSLTVNGAGRTDAGVHARGQIANFKADCNLTEREIQDYLNHYLPKDICVTSVHTVPDTFHARLNACGKHYEYRIWNKKERNVFASDTSWHIPEQLNIDQMKKSAALLEGTHDFTSFCAYKGKKSKVRTINSISITREEGFVTISFLGNGFLYKMVRIIVGTLVQIGLGESMDLCAILEKKNRELAGMTAPPHGLFLNQVFYPKK